MGSILDDIKQKLSGAWVLDRTENFEQALQEMGEHIFLYHIEKNIIQFHGLVEC